MGETGNFYDITFIYHPDDSAFLGRIAAQLRAVGLACHIDSLETGKDHDSAQLKDGLLRAHNIGIALSPAAAESQLCNELIQYAVTKNKKLITLILDEDIRVEVHPAIAENPFVFFREQDELLAQLDALRGYLAADTATQLHTELLVAAEAWQAAGRGGALLLPPERAPAARAWLTADNRKASPLLVEYIHRSRRQKPPRRPPIGRWLALGLAGLLALGLGLLLLRAALSSLAASQQEAAQTSVAETPLALTRAAATAIHSSGLGTVDALAAASLRLAAAVRETAQAAVGAATQAAGANSRAQAQAARRATQARATEMVDRAREADASRLLEAGEVARAGGDSETALAFAWAAKEALPEPQAAYRLLRRILAPAGGAADEAIALPAARPGSRLSPSGESLLLVADNGLRLRAISAQENLLELAPGSLASAGPYFAQAAAEAIQVYALASGAVSQRWPGDWADIDALYLAPDGQSLLVAETAGLGLLRAGANGPQPLTLPSKPSQVLFAAAGGRFLTLHEDSALLWQTESGAALAAYPLGIAADGLQAAFSADGAALVFFAQLAEGLASLTRVDLADNSAQRHTFVDVLAGGLTADGAFLALARADGALQIFETAQGALLHSFVGAAAPVNTLQYQPAADLLIVADAQGLSLWHVPSGALEGRLPQAPPVVDFQFSADTWRALTVDASGGYRLWQMESNADLLARIESEGGPRPLSCAEREEYLVRPLCE